jgi:hypothetical protein
MSLCYGFDFKFHIGTKTWKDRKDLSMMNLVPSVAMFSIFSLSMTAFDILELGHVSELLFK